jgi:hypothetical protein
MISSAEFDRQLQAGHIAQALALLLSETNEIDITTEMTDDIRANHSDSGSCGHKIVTDRLPKSEYLRTRINLLTGEIHNEVGKDAIVNSSSYLKLQQLHIEQIVASHRIVQGHLQQIQAMLTAMPPQQTASIESKPADESSSARFDLADSLPSRLTEAFRAILTSPTGDLSGNIPTEPSEDLTLSQLPQPSSPLSRLSSQVILSPTAFDDDIDLSLDENTVEWEEWIEDERIESERIEAESPTIPTAAVSQDGNIPTWGADWERQFPSPQPTTVKPLKSRTMATSAAIDPSEQWDKFIPEHLGIYVDPKPNSSNYHHDPHQVDRLLADLDKISQGQGNRG